MGPTDSRPAMTTTKTLKLSLARPSAVNGFWRLVITRREGVKLTICRARLPLAVVTMVVTRDQRLVDVDRVGDGLAETVTLENHGE